MIRSADDPLPPLDEAIPLSEQVRDTEMAPANLVVLVPRAEMDEPTSWWSVHRFMHGWARYAELEEHLRALATRVHPPKIWRTHDDPVGHAFVDWSNEDFVQPSDHQRISLLGSEAVHHLRSSLDHLVYNAGWKDSGTRPRHTQFPIVSNRNDWNRERRNSLRPLSQAHVEWIEAVQPYHGDGWARDLQILSNMDKHQFAMQISPSVEIQINHEQALPDPDDDSRLLLGITGVTLRALLVEDTRHREATTVLPDMLLGAARLINLFLAEDGLPLMDIEVG